MKKHLGWSSSEHMIALLTAIPTHIRKFSFSFLHSRDVCRKNNFSCSLWVEESFLHNQTGFLACTLLRSRERLRWCKKIRFRGEGNEKLEKLQTIKTIEVLFSCEANGKKIENTATKLPFFSWFKLPINFGRMKYLKFPANNRERGAKWNAPAQFVWVTTLHCDPCLFVTQISQSVYENWSLHENKQQAAGVQRSSIGHVYSLSKDCFGLISAVLWLLHRRGMHFPACKVKQTRVAFPEVLLFGQNLFELL